MTKDFVSMTSRIINEIKEVNNKNDTGESINIHLIVRPKQNEATVHFGDLFNGGRLFECIPTHANVLHVFRHNIKVLGWVDEDTSYSAYLTEDNYFRWLEFKLTEDARKGSV